MPRGPVGGATAALIRALAEQDVRVSVFQIERWRASGDLPSPVRHGRGRGRGMVSEPPDEATVTRALVLGKLSRQGSRRFGTHPVERVALRLPVAEAAVRTAVDAALDQVARMTAADVVDPDAGSWARETAVNRAMRERGGTFTWQDLVDAVDGAPERPDLPAAARRAAMTGVIAALGAGEEALPEDLVAVMSLHVGLAPEQVDELRRVQTDAELRGEASWVESLAQQLSVHHMRQVAAEAPFDRLQRAIQVVSDIATWQSMAVLLGILDVAGKPFKTNSPLDRFDAAVIRQLQQDPMWPEVNAQRLNPKPQLYVRHLVLSALGLLISGRLPAWEAYRDRLMHLTNPPHTHDAVPPLRSGARTGHPDAVSDEQGTRERSRP